MEVTPACYAHLINSLLSYACGRVAVFLEVNLFLVYFYKYISN